MYRRLPNLLTVLRLGLALVFFIVLNRYRYGTDADHFATVVLWMSIVLFILAALTDTLDGYLARRWKVESTFGRIMDPVCDKVLIIGAFIYLASPRFVIPEKVAADEFFNMASGVYPWMVVIILARELLVTGVRDQMESSGVKFSAMLFGKLKMILQSITVPTVLFIVWLDPVAKPWTTWFREAFVYATVIVTFFSAWPYIAQTARALRQRDAAITG